MNVVERQALRVGRECWNGREDFEMEYLDQWWLLSRGGRDRKQERERLDAGAENRRDGASNRKGLAQIY